MSSENGSASATRNIEKCSLILVDVAGTTTSINFLKDTLFPFAIKEAEAFLQAKWDDKTVKECIEAIKEKDELNVKTAAERIKTLTEENSPNEGFKKLQGLIYESGYEKGDLKAHVFEDVPEMFGVWAQSKKIAIYSTGSVDSQKQLFSHTILGDLTNHITAYFDQGIGPKTDPESYKKIAKEVEVEVEDIVFITDDLKEAEAAKTCGVQAVLISRDENSTADEAKFIFITSFKNLAFEKIVKRKNEDQSNTEEPPAKIVKTDETEEEKTEVSSKDEKNEAGEEDEKMEEEENVPEKTDSKKTDEIKNKKTDTSQNEEIEKMEVDVVVEAKEVKEPTPAEEATTSNEKSVVEEASSSKEKASESKIDVVESVTKTDAAEKSDSTNNICSELTNTSDKEETKDSKIVEEKQKEDTQPILKSDETSESSKDCEMESQTVNKEETKDKITEIVEGKSLPSESDTDSTKNDCSQTKREEMEVAKDEKLVTNSEIAKTQKEVKTEENRSVSESKKMDVDEAEKTESKNGSVEDAEKSSGADGKESVQCNTEAKLSDQKVDTIVQGSSKEDAVKAENTEERFQCGRCGGTEWRYLVKKDTVLETEKQEMNGDDKSTVEITTTTSVKTDEKENNSVLANGVENGKNASETKENTSETVVETKPDDVEEPEVKVKKLEEVVDSPAVSVEA